MNAADRYLTRKTRVSRIVVLLENTGAIALFLMMAALVYVAVYGYQVDGFDIGHLFLCLAEVVLVLPLNVITERKRARKHAQLIVEALLEQETGCVPCDELEKLCGVRKAAQRAVQLTEKGYLKDVLLRRGMICLADMAPQEPEAAEEIKPIFRN